ncbi:MAG TPA: septum formation initiator family protein [Pyrinomonadaceae bacterium]|nr:septum formation initiator family protein [Pyrinomonadaceae bacterium]
MNKVVNTYSLNNRLAAQRPSPLAATANTARPVAGTSQRKTPVYLPGRAEARERIAKRAAARQNKFIPNWIIFVFVVAITFALCVILNVKTRSEMQKELLDQQQLHTEIEQLQNFNSALADEVRRLQSDPATIERAARERLGMVGKNEQVLVLAR